jgi:hypothetical protein
MMEKLQHSTGKWYEIKDINGNGDKNDKALKEYVRTHKYDFNPGLEPSHFDSVTDLKTALKRDKKINQTNFIIPPKRIMP